MSDNLELELIRAIKTDMREAVALLWNIAIERDAAAGRAAKAEQIAAKLAHDELGDCCACRPGDNWSREYLEEAAKSPLSDGETEWLEAVRGAISQAIDDDKEMAVICAHRKISPEQDTPPELPT